MSRALISSIASSFVKLFAGAALVWLTVSISGVLLLRWFDPPVSAFMIQQNGALSDLERQWRDRSEISWHMAWAVIASEDQRFLQHRGFDLSSIRQAIDEYRSGEQLRGASTITQQVAKNLFLWPGRSLLRKGLEAYFTVLIELFWPKERTLEIYLNIAEFGEGVFGVDTATRRFFHAGPRDLSRAQAALLSAVLPSPKRLNAAFPSPYVRERQIWILGQMRRLEAQPGSRRLDWP